MNLTIFQYAKSNPRVGLKLDNAKRTIVCSVGSRENLDTKSSPIYRIAINVPPCLVATKQSSAKCHKMHIIQQKQSNVAELHLK